MKSDYNPTPVANVPFDHQNEPGGIVNANHHRNRTSVAHRLVGTKVTVVLVTILANSGLGQADESKISFNRDIRPILTDHCFACHGPDAKAAAADLRLDLADRARKSAIVSGDAAASELIVRITESDPDTIMPPPELHKPLDQGQIDLLKRWIDDGAHYEQHWAYLPLRRPSVSELHGADSDHPVDRFIDNKLRANQIESVEQADRVTLIRRLSFDLTGLPPTREQVQAFVEDDSVDAWDKLVDRLLDSPQYGERMATYWLDLVRYADTVGYHGDQNVSVSPYRDYVINSFNNNMPYDRFVAEQLAGDLLPNPTMDQLIATGYNRLNQTTEEGGAQPKEYLAIYFADRVRNVSQVFMGATVGCAQCHDHKYDPYTAKDFYSLGAFFADIDERGKYNGRERKPEMAVPTAAQEQQLSELQQLLEPLHTRLRDLRQNLRNRPSELEEVARKQLASKEVEEHIWIAGQRPVADTLSGEWSFVEDNSGKDVRKQTSRRQSADGLVQHFALGTKTKITVEEDSQFFAWIYINPLAPPEAVMIQLHAGNNNGGWSHRAVWGNDSISYGRQSKSHAGYQRMGPLPKTGEWVRLRFDSSDVGLKAGDAVSGIAFTQFKGTVFWQNAGWSSSAILPLNIVDILGIAREQRSEAQQQSLTETLINRDSDVQNLNDEIESLKGKLQRLEDSFTKTLVTKSVAPRPIRILPRGNWMDDSGPLVEPAIPEFLGQLNTNARPTRLDLANWLCSDDNVLTSRTMVNRLWYLMFGRGLASSVDDLGGQGTYPSHPQLLDYLAVEFVESGWDIKHLVKVIVTSRAYQRTSVANDRLLTADPYNEFIARQGRFRLDAEMVRDTALKISGLLVDEIGGPSVRPYQPAGYYDQLNFPKRSYQPDHGTAQYRRGIYTHWQRTFLHPMLKAFDAPSREECTAKRPSSNTPLQALTLLNDPTFVEAARAFAERAIREASTSDQARIEFLYEEAVSKQPDEFIVEQLTSVLENHRAAFSGNSEAAEAFLQVGLQKPTLGPDTAELAAWTGVTRVILNLRETTTRY